MRLLLLDTHVVLWQLSGERQLSSAAVEAIAEADELYFSVVSFAEIGIKAATGKLVVPTDLHAQIINAGVRILQLDAEVGLSVADLPIHHRDPFDRLLIAQAVAERLTVVSADRRFDEYPIRVISAA